MVLKTQGGEEGAAAGHHYEKGLSQYPDQSAMPVKAWKNRDKISAGFLLELPGPHNPWSSAEWAEALCLLLSLPSNACKSVRNLGQPIGNRFVDIYGCEVLCATLPGVSLGVFDMPNPY